MTNQRSTIDAARSEAAGPGREQRPVLALVIAWSRHEPGRVGEVMLFEMEGAAQILGRGAPTGTAAGRVVLRRLRPGEGAPSPPLASAAISREQLRITARRGKLDVVRIGRCAMLHHGDKVDRCSLSPGDTLLLDGQMLFLCTTRPAASPALRDFPAHRLREFGEPDELGLLGESPAMWRLREALAFQAKAGAHTLVLGPSGAGKELCARAIHLLSSRAGGPFVARNAATLPPGLVDAELFGNAKNYPNPGMAERPGLVGAADGGTLFLDEIGEMPMSVHANLLRVLDECGEYHRLGETETRRSNLRLIAATNRAPEVLKHDLRARLSLQVRAPGLDELRDDIPLLIRHLLRRARTRSPDLLARFTDTSGEIRVSAALVEHLLGRAYTTHVRELDSLLWRAMAESPDGVVDLTDSLRAVPSPRPEGDPGEEAAFGAREGDPDTSRAEVLARLAENGGNLAATARALGLSSRYVLYRLLRKHHIDVDGLRGDKR